MRVPTFGSPKGKQSFPERTRPPENTRSQQLKGGLVYFFSSCLSHSALNASIGSSLAARHAGHNPLIIPTTDETVTPIIAELILNNNGKPIMNDNRYARPNPVNTPTAPPIAVTVTASIKNC